MERPTRDQRKAMRTLSEKAYELELSALLTKLRERFDKWEAGEISPWELSDAIREFHEGDSQDLYQFYGSGTDYTFHVAHAIKNGTFTMNDVPDFCRERMQLVLETLSDF